MTKLKVTVELNSACNLTVTDTSGFYNSVSNVNGFIPEDNTDPTELNVYKLSDGYSLNVLLYNKYASTPIVSNRNETFYNILSDNVEPVYADNYVPSIYALKQDGVYTIKRFFIPSLEFYNVHSEDDAYVGIVMYYVNDDIIYKVVDNIAEVITLDAFLVEDLLGSNVLTSSTMFISTCYTNSCYFKILSTVLDMSIGICVKGVDYDKLIQKRDFLYMTLEVIKYLKEQNNISQIQKLIESIDICGKLCQSTLKSVSSTNCGCNG